MSNDDAISSPKSVIPRDEFLVPFAISLDEVALHAFTKHEVLQNIPGTKPSDLEDTPVRL